MKIILKKWNCFKTAVVIVQLTVKGLGNEIPFTYISNISIGYVFKVIGSL